MALRAEQRRWLILAVICIAQLMAVLDVAVVNIALPAAQRALQPSPWAINRGRPRRFSLTSPQR